MNPSATDDRTAAFARLLQELRDRPPGTSGEWLARLVAEIRPRGRDGVAAGSERLRSLIAVLQAQPDSAAALNAHLGALAGNFLFGCMLGCTPIAGELLGLPLDIRHVAFSSANFAYGLNALEFAVPVSTVVVSFAGVLLIGLVNLVVSFWLALKVALRSRGIAPEQTRGLWPRVLRRFMSRPRDFFWPPAAVAAI
jgi:site-specific recombinase